MSYSAQSLPTVRQRTGWVTIPNDPMWVPAAPLLSISTVLTSMTWPTADQAVMFEIVAPYNCTVYRMGWVNGSSAGDNTDVGIYDSDQATRLVSAGATAGSGNNTIQTVNTTDVALTKGKTYYVAMNHSGTTANRLRGTSASNRWTVNGFLWAGIKIMAVGATALPATFVPADPAASFQFAHIFLDIRASTA